MPELRVGYVRVCNFFSSMHLRRCIGTWSLCKAVPYAVESVCRRKFRLKAWREWLDTYLQPELRLKFKDEYLSNVSCMPSTRPPTNESTRYLNDFSRFVKIVRGFKKKKRKKRRRHWQQTCWFQGASGIQMHGWARRPRSFEEQYIFGFK